MIRRFPVRSATLLTALAAVLCAAPGAWAQAVDHPFSFSLLPGQIPTLRLPQFAWGDADRDGDLDIFASGLLAEGATLTPYSAVLRNDGLQPNLLAPGGVTVRLTPRALPFALAHGGLDLGDVDRDGDLDLLVAGSETATAPYRPRAILYRNDGGTFTDSGVALPQVFGGAVRLADVTGDGALDVLVTGAPEATAPYTPTTTLLRQTGGWTFAAMPSGLPGHAFGELRTLDADGDGDPDILLGGYTRPTAGSETGPALATALYLNTGGTFAASALALPAGLLARLDAVRVSGSLDVAVTGGTPFPMGLDGRAALALGATHGGSAGTRRPIDRLVGGTVRFTDIDDDGDFDLLVAGQMQAGAPALTRLLRRADGSSGGGSSSPVFDLAGHLVGLRQGSASLGDIDGDGDLDVVAAGLDRAGETVGALYRNDRWGRAATPSRPVGLVATPDGAGGLRLTWTPTAGTASYAVRVGTQPGADDLLAADADADGWRTVAAAGPLAEPSFALYPTLISRTDGGSRVYVGVQAVSPGFVGSPFAEIALDAATATDADASERPVAWALAAPRPSPLRGTGRVAVAVPTAGAHVVLDVVDVLGRVLVRLHDGPMAAGSHEVALDTAPLPAGSYVLRLRTAAGQHTHALVVAR